MNIPKTTQQAVGYLRSGCEQLTSCLNELIDIHFEMDAPDRSIRPDEEEIVYRLRKILLHTKSVTIWQLNLDIMQVLAPELDAANEQIDIIWKKIPKDQLREFLASDKKNAGEMVRPGSKFREGLLSSYVHPTPQGLLLAKEQGGLGMADEVRYYMNLFILLGDLVFRYGVSLYFLSQLLDGRKEEPIASVMKKISQEFGSISPRDCLRFVAQEGSIGELQRLSRNTV